ncbi:MAG: 6-bladed beta-propeller [Longimonas sp.]|uniref:6-bladed beta-propeller n=1 Tax=Longimonas sp. TaxID=2039626 RepID=UPI00335E7C7D
MRGLLGVFTEVAIAFLSVFGVFAPPLPHESSGDPQLIFEEVYRVGVLEGKDTEMFGDIRAVALTSEGYLFVGDKDTGSIHVFNKDGDYHASFGSEGQGPGEFRSITSFALSAEEDSLYVLDSQLRRMSVYTTDTFEHQRDVQLGFQSTFLLDQLGVYQQEDLFYTVGHVIGERTLIHFFDNQGELVRSIAEMQSIDDPRFDDEVIWNQVNNGEVVQATNGDLFAALRAPYRIWRVSSDGTPIWKRQDDVLPPPWEEHILFTPQQYEVTAYPEIYSLHQLGEDYLVVVYINPEQDEGHYDLLNPETGEQVVRHAFPPEQRLRDLATVDGEYWCAIEVSEPFPQVRIARLEVSQ